ncbi:hypothetical protein ACHAWF_010192 [Thalassiosira exigua]
MPLRQNVTEGLAAGLRAEAQRFQEESKTKASQKMSQIHKLTLQQQKDLIRRVLIDIGTEVSLYDDDPTGDGDQSMICPMSKRDEGRELYAIGGDIHAHLATENAMSSFALCCAMGSAEAVKRAIQVEMRGKRMPYSRSSNLKTLLESRETSMRLSPLLMIVSAGKNLKGPFPGMQQHGETAKILLRHGASPVAKDVLGKTVCHYGAGMVANDMTLEVVDICTRAAISHYLHAKDVSLRGLNAEDMNGRVGVAGGFDCDTGRRSVYLPEEDREIWVKIENIELSSESSGEMKRVNLPDVQDRFGGVSLQEVIMTDRVDVAEFLLRKHHTSIHTTDMDGVSPLKQAIGMGQLTFPASRIVLEVAKDEGRDSTRLRREAKRSCAKCKVNFEDNGYACSRCKAIWYCGRDCQVAHWRIHKSDCKQLAVRMSGVKLDPPDKMRRATQGMHSLSMSFATRSVHEGGSYEKPPAVDVGKKFAVKVQAMGDRSPILIYDKTRFCTFEIPWGQQGFIEVLSEVRKEKAWGGRKTFMKASFDRSGTCTLYPESAGVRSHYTW